jgi:hypothetical protein
MTNELVLKSVPSEDWTEENLKTISSINLHNMTVEELVTADGAAGERFHLSGGVWWREVKPYFYQPALFTARVPINGPKPSFWRAMGGYYHMVPDGSPCNGTMVVTEVAEPAAYSLERLTGPARSQIRRGLARTRIRPMTNLDDILNDGYQVYLRWEKRTHDARVKRSSPDTFRSWMTRLFEHPHNVILGTYHEDRLISYVVFYAAGGVADLTKSFTDLRFSGFYPSVALLYAFVRIAGQNPTIHKACHGLKSYKTSLERFKIKFGFSHVTYPAYICLRRPFRPLARRLMPVEYRRLMGQYDDEGAPDHDRSPAAPQSQG